MNNLSGFNTQEMRRLHPYLATLLRRLKALEVKVETGTRIVWGRDEDVLPTGNENLAGILNRFARADHQHLLKFPVAVPLTTPDGTAFFDLSTSAINIYVDDTPTTRVVAGGTDDDVRATKRRDTGTVPRYAFADHSHPTAVLPQDDPQPPEIDEIRYDEDDKLVRWDGDNWVPLSVETADTEAGTEEDVQPTKTRSAGSSTRYARADHSHPTAILSQDDAQTPEIDEIRYNTDDKLVRWDGSSWVPLSVETGGAEAGTNDDVQPTRLRDAGSSTRYARADHSHPTALLPQTDPQTPVAGEIRYNADDKLVRWDGSGWVEVSVEEVEAGVDADVQPTKLLSAGQSSRFAKADHSHPTAILPQGDAQTPETDEIRYTANNKIVRWNGSAWVPLSVETFTVEWGDDVEPTRRRSAGSSTRFARADHSHPTAILPQDDTQTPVADEIRFSEDDKIVRWNGSEWVPLSVETFDFEVEWGADDDVQPTKLKEAGASTRFARADHSHPTAILPQDDPQTPEEDEIRYNDENKIVRWDGTEWVPLSVETFTIDWGTNNDVQPTGTAGAGIANRVARADHSHPTALLPEDNTQTPVPNEIRFNADNKIVRWDGDDWVPLSVETFEIEWATNADVQPTKLRSTGSSARFARADHSHPTAILPQSNAQTPETDEIRYNDDNKLVRWDGDGWVELSVETVEAGLNGDVQPTKLRDAGSSPRFARADHSHPTAILPQDNTQTPATDEIRYNDNNKIVRWDGNDWVEMSVETVEAGLDNDVQPTKLRSAGTSTRLARADHSHPTAILPQGNAQTPVADEIRYNTDNKIVRWDGSAWVPLSVETFEIEWGADDDVQPTKLRSAGTSTQFARADHSHPTAILPQDDAQTPEEDEIRYNDDNKLVRWDGSDWVELSVETVEAGVLSDVQPTKLKSTGTSTRFARADHSHPTALLPESDPQTPVVDEIRYNSNDKIVRWDGSGWVPLSVETGGGEAGLLSDVQPTKLKSAGTTTRYARADHSHPTAILPQSDTQPPVADEIRYNSNDKLVRWDGSAWVQVSVEEVEAGTNNDVEPTGLRSAGISTRFARADHSHPTAILHQNDIPSPVIDEIAYNADDKLVRWDGADWVVLSDETIEAGLLSDVQPTRFRSAGTSARYARADHSHPTAILPQSDTQTPAFDEIRYTGTNRLVRWNGTEWVNLVATPAVPADPLILPFTNDVSSPQDRQLVNHSGWDNIGNATIFYRDTNNAQYRLVFARPLAVATASTPSGRDFWANQANELVLKQGTGFIRGSVLWNRRGGTTEWSPVAPQLSADDDISLPTDVGVLSRSPLTGTSGSRRWFLRGAQEDGSFRAPFVGFASFASADTPAHGDLATNLNDGYAYFIHDIDRVDIVRPTTNGSRYPTMLSHSIIAPPCRIFSTATDPSGHYVVDELWNFAWAIAFYTTTSANTELLATLPTIAVPYGITAGRILLYLHNPQSSAFAPNFSVRVRRPTSTGMIVSSSTAFTSSIPANTTVVADLGFLPFLPSPTLPHHRSHLITISIVRSRQLETANSNKILCLGVVIIPQRAS